MTPDEVNALCRRVMESGGEQITPDEARELALQVGTLRALYEAGVGWMQGSGRVMLWIAEFGGLPGRIPALLRERVAQCPVGEMASLGRLLRLPADNELDEQAYQQAKDEVTDQ